MTDENKLATYDEQLAALAREAVDQASKGGGGLPFFSIRGGSLTFGGDAIPGNEIAVVLVDSIYEHVYYPGRFDPEERQGPTCFAFGRDPGVMAPHEDAEDAQSTACRGCPMDEFGSAEYGKGKACKNRLRVAVLSVGSFDRDGNFEPSSAEDVASGEVAYLNVPVTSTKAYDKYIKGLVKVHGLAPQAAATAVRVSPDPRNQVRVEFELLDRLPNDVVGAVLSKLALVREEIETPYQAPSGDPAEPARGGAKEVTKAERRKPAKY